MKKWNSIPCTELNENTFQLIGSDWMLVAAKKEDKANAMTASWGGLGIMWGKPVAFVVIRESRYTKEFVDAAGQFSLTFFSDEYKKELGYFGSVSGRDEDKIQKTGFHVLEADETPYFDEGKLALICNKLYAQPFAADSFIDKSIFDKWYGDNDLHTMYIAEIKGAYIPE